MLVSTTCSMRSVKTINVAPFVAVLLVMAAVFASTVHVSMGLPLRIARMGPCYPGDRRVVVIQLLADGSININVDPVSRSELGNRLDGIFRTRAVRLAYVTAEPNVPFGKVAAVIDIATMHLDHIALLPRSKVISRKPYPGESDTCVEMTFTERDAKTSDQVLSVWH
jgi:biopolymer transport protein ExbD